MNVSEPVCQRCQKWQDKQSEILMKCDTIFSVHIDLVTFEEDCIKTCPFLCDSQPDEKLLENS